MNASVCMLIARFYPYLGGTELQALRLANKLIEKNTKVYVVTQRYSPELVPFEIINQVPVYRLLPLGYGFFAAIGFMISSFIWLWQNKQLYQIIHVHLVSSHTIVAVIISKLLNKKTVIKFAGARKTGDIGTSVKKPLGKLKLLIVRVLGNIFVCPSNEVKQEMLVWGFSENKIRKIANGVDTEYFKPVSDKKMYREMIGLKNCNELIVIYTGRLEPGKGLEFLVSIWKEVLDRLGEISLSIVGDGTIKKTLESIVYAADIDQYIHFWGWQKDVIPYLLASNIFVLPSLGEGLSNALLESMASGLVPVVTDIESNQEVVKNSVNGLLFQPNNKTELIDILTKLKKNQGLVSELSNNARKTVTEDYSIEKVVGEYEQLYENLG